MLVLLFVVVSTRALRGGALLEAAAPVRRPGEGRHAEPAAHATLALLPRTAGERRLFTRRRRDRRASARSGSTAGSSSPWSSALAGGPADRVLVAVAAVAFGLAHAYQGRVGVLTTGVLGGVMAALYLETGSLLLPVLLHAAIDLRFLLVPARVLPAGRACPVTPPTATVAGPGRLAGDRRPPDPGLRRWSRACRRRSSRTTATPTPSTC